MICRSLSFVPTALPVYCANPLPWRSFSWLWQVGHPLADIPLPDARIEVNPPGTSLCIGNLTAFSGDDKEAAEEILNSFVEQTEQEIVRFEAALAAQEHCHAGCGSTQVVAIIDIGAGRRACEAACVG